MTITVYGLPAPQGSKRYVGHSRAGHAIIIESSAKVKPWREAVLYAAVEVMGGTGKQRISGPVSLSITFTLPRPKSAPKKRLYPDSYPDLSKLVRATEDALTAAGVWEDDARVVAESSSKRFAGDVGVLPVPGALIRIEAVA